MLIKTFLFILLPVVIVGILLKLNQMLKWKTLETFFSKLDSMIYNHKNRRKLVFEVYLILLVFMVALFSFGNGRPVARGNEYNIKVLADSADWSVLEEVVKTTFEREIRTPQPEKMFSVFRFGEKAFNTFKKDRQFIILGTLQSKGKTGEIIRSEIAERKIGVNITNDDQFWFNLGDKWAQDQNVVLLVGKGIHSLRNQIQKNGDKLFSYFQQVAGKTLKESLFTGEIERQLVSDVFKKYGWTFTKFSELSIQAEETEKNFVLFSATILDRWMFVHWVENADTSLLNANWIRQRRNDLTNAFLHGQTVEDHFYQFVETTFLNRPAIITSGLWARNDIIIGGPFKNYTFYDDVSKRLYMIDTFAFNPGKEKLPLLKRLDVIANTFQTEYELVE